MAKEKGKSNRKTREKPISLYPLTPEEALKKLLQVHPPKKQKKKNPK